MTPNDPKAADALEAGTDYLYCPICGTHAPCRPTPGGGWETVHAPLPPAVPGSSDSTLPDPAPEPSEDAP